MKIYTGMLYAAARLQVLYSRATLSAPSAAEHEDMLPASLIPSFARGDRSDRILAEIDQDGFVFAVDPVDREIFNTGVVMNPRKHHRIQIVLTGGMVRLRKEAVRKRHLALMDRIRAFLHWEFYIEAAALLRLRGLAFVPAIRGIDRRRNAIEMDYIWGQDFRQILAQGAHEIAYDEISRSFAQLFTSGDGDEIPRQLSETVISIVGRGVIPRDVHAANFIRGRRSNRFYMVDFNQAYFYPVPGWRSHVRDLTWLFGDRVNEILR
jgi:hypothetical protein